MPKPTPAAGSEKLQRLDKSDGSSKDILADNIAKLKELFPEVFAEGKIDFDALKQLLGEYVDDANERYSFTWNGKSKARWLAQTRSMGTLRPCPEESVNWDTTENLFIEGDNLEVLKLLQKSYYKKIKMIYIDPPYNTGNDFVYPDNFRNNIKNYIELTSQADGNGRKLSTNPETSGRYHTDWLNMMYPRLKLARNLLRDDGVIFISIDDHEVASLRLLCDEVFGEENLLAGLVWNKNHSAQAGIFKLYHEYVLAYAKNAEAATTPRSGDGTVFLAGAMKRESARHAMQDFRFPKGTRFDAPEGTELTGSWGGAERVELRQGRMVAADGRLAEDVVLRAAYTQLNQMRQYFYGDRDSLIDSRGQRVTEFFFTASGKIRVAKERAVSTPATVGNWGTQGEATKKLAELFEGGSPPFDTPKSTSMPSDFAKWFADEGSIVLDFFAGSATTAHAVLDLNKQDGGNRKFILVQLPEPCPADSEAFKAGYKNIAEIGKERIRRVIKKIQAEQSQNTKQAALPGMDEKPRNLDLGFKVLKLDSSNIKTWDPDFDQFEHTLLTAAEIIKPDRSEADVLYEILLKYGLDLTLPVEKREIGGKVVHIIGGGGLVVCLASGMTLGAVEKIAALKKEFNPETPPGMRMVFKDAGFANDELKTNAAQILKQHGIEDVRAV